MPSSILYYLDRKTSNKLVWFVIIMLVLTVFWVIIFPGNEKSNSKANKINQEIKDSVR